MALCIDQPLRFDANGDLHSTTDLINSKIEQLIMTKGYADGKVGEIPWDTNLGCGVYLLRHQNLPKDVALKLAETYITSALMKYLPEIDSFNLEAKTFIKDGGHAISITVFWRMDSISDLVDLEI